MRLKTKPLAGKTILNLTQGLHIKYQRKFNSEDFLIKFGLLALLTVQNAVHVLAMRYIRMRPQQMFLPTVAVFFTEIIKLIACFVFVTIEQRSFFKCLQVMQKQIVRQPLDTLKVCVPALLYVLISILMYTAVSNLAAATFMVTFQLKVFSAALFTVLLLHRRLSIIQWISLPVLLAGIVLVQLDEKSAEEHAKVTVVQNELIQGGKDAINLETTSSNPVWPSTTMQYEHIENQKPLLGLVAVIVICILSGFAGVFLEKILKEKKEVSVWIRNIQLCIISLPVSIASVFIKDSKKVLEQGFFVGFDLAVWFTVCFGAFGGLIVAIIIKYTDNILKAFATSFAVVLSCIFSAFIFHFQPTVMFVIGAFLAVLAACVYSAYPYKNKYKLTALDPISSIEEEKQRLQPV